MALLGLLEAQDQRAQIRHAQPMRHHPAQHAALVTEQCRRQRALAGHHQRDAAAATLLAAQEGMKRLYLIVSFMPLDTADGRKVERAIEFFMPVGQSGESQQWITSTMRSLSLAARGGFLDRALEDLRKVAWDRGPVRLGTYQKADGTNVPRWHDSEVAAIAYAIQNLIAQRSQPELPMDDLGIPAPNSYSEEPALAGPGVMAGKKCPECGAHAMIRKDGCDYCTSCGHMGSCG